MYFCHPVMDLDFVRCFAEILHKKKRDAIQLSTSINNIKKKIDEVVKICWIETFPLSRGACYNIIPGVFSYS